MGEVRVADTEQVKRINGTAGNRRIADEGMACLDHEGLHVLEPLMLHNETEMRCLAHLKMAGTMRPASVLLDVPLAEYEALPDVEVR